MILDNRRNITREIADDVDISYSSGQAILTDVLGKKRSEAKIVLKLMNRMDIVQEMLTTFNDDRDLLKNVITGDESWM